MCAASTRACIGGCRPRGDTAPPGGFYWETTGRLHGQDGHRTEIPCEVRCGRWTFRDVHAALCAILVCIGSRRPMRSVCVGALRPEPPVVVCAKAMRLAGRVLCRPAATGDSKSEAQALTSQKRHHPLCAVHVRFVCARFPPRPAGVARAVRSGGGDRAWSRISQHNYVI